MLRTFLKVRITSFREDSNKQWKVTLRLRHAHQLIYLLFKHLLHHRFTAAAELMPAVSTCYYWTPEIVGKCGIEALLHDKAGYSEALQLYKQLFLQTHKLREEFFLEMMFFLVSHGNTKEAFDMFQGVINQDPFRSNPLCRGYCGLLAYMLWWQQREQQYSLEDDDDEKLFIFTQDSSMLAASQTQESQFAKQADQHWREMVQLLPGAEGVMDSFIHKYWHLLLQLDRMEDSLDLLKFYRDLYPHHINAHRYLLTHINSDLYVKDESSGDLRVECWTSLAELDPSCNEVLHLVRHRLECGGNPDYADVFHKLLRYLDYPHNGLSNSTAWELLSTVQDQWSAYKTSSQWTCRLSWWIKLYPNHVTIEPS